MSTATTAPTLPKERDVGLDALHVPLSYSLTGLETWKADPELANGTRPDKAQLDPLANRCYVVRVPTVATDYAVKIFQYGGDRDALILVDFEEPEDEFPKDHLETVRFLRANGRPILADKTSHAVARGRGGPRRGHNQYRLAAGYGPTFGGTRVFR